MIMMGRTRPGASSAVVRVDAAAKAAYRQLRYNGLVGTEFGVRPPATY
jgi:hypothetical protein